MHTIIVHKKIHGLLKKMYVVAVSKAMGIKLPNKVKLITQETEETFRIMSFSIEGVKKEPGD